MDAEIRSTLADASGVLFLCSGNVVRSAFADLYARHLGCPLPVRSAATTYETEEIHPQSARALLKLGLGREEILEFRPTFIRDLRDELDPDWIVFGMTAEHVSAMSLHPRLRGRTFLMTRLLGQEAEPIEDPLFHDHWDEAFDTIRRCVDALVAAAREARAAP